MQTVLEAPQQIHELNGLRYIARKVTMVSIFPIACVAFRNFGPEMTGAVNQKYVLPAAEKGSYSTLEIYDAFQRIPDNDATQAIGRQVFHPSPIACRIIANDFFKEWVENRLGCGGGYRPGIGIIEGDKPSKEFLAALVPQQEAYAKGLYHDAQGMADKHQFRQITELHREMAKWLGLKATWIEDMETSKQDMKKCTECRMEIPADARVCHICRNVQQKAA
jgi:hypothetical protein